VVSNLTREDYMLPMDHPIAIENIRRHISKSKKFDNLFSADELDNIWKQSFKDHRSARMNRNGTVIISGGLQDIYCQFKSKIDLCLGSLAGQSPVIGGNYFITPQQYGLHNDSSRPENYINSLKRTPIVHERRKYTSWKNFLLPLWIGTHLDVVDGGQIAFFDQRHIDWAHVYNGGGLVPNIASVYKICTDYSELQFYNGNGAAILKQNNKIPFDKEIYNTWMNTPYDRLQGLSLENVMEWTPGSPMVFDAVQLHNSNEGSKNLGQKTWNSKMGLLLTYLIELDEDLLLDWRIEQQTPSTKFI